MALLALPLALLTAALGAAQSPHRSFLQVVIPERIPPEAMGNQERMAFVIAINEKSYMIYLKQQSFLSNDFRVYTYTRGSSVSFAPSIQRDCYYQGYVDGYTDSVVMISSCSGLSGLMHFENISYGIEPLELAAGFRHLVYLIDYNSAGSELSKQNYTIIWHSGIYPKSETKQSIHFSTVRYVEIHVIVSKSLYDFMGSNEDVVMQKIIQLISYINAMFYKLNLKIILSSLELWMEEDKILTTGTAGQVLELFLKWKKDHLSLRPHDVAFLFVYRNMPSFVGSTFAKQMCSKPKGGGVAMFQKGMSLENFSVIVAQLMGFSMGLYFEESSKCHCTGTVCLMDTKAVHSSGIKAFSSCSVKDFQNFLSSGSAQCLQNKPYLDVMHRTPFCGNGIVEDGEQCDCGTLQECENNPCCESDCTLKKGKQCAQGHCCWERKCRLKAKGTLCRDPPDEDCDLKEYCNGTSADCTEDFYVQDGQWCEDQTGVCMKGVCQSPDRWCRKMFGENSRSGTSQCYEEINSQKDRMGHCGSNSGGYQSCQWQDLKCGKLVCEYPSKMPFFVENAAIIYAKVQNHICVTLDYMKGPGMKDPFMVRDGSSCGENKICMNQKCVNRAVIKLSCDEEEMCHGKGRCNNKGNCHCDLGWAPPDCRKTDRGGLGGSIDSSFRSGFIMDEKAASTRNWLLISFFIFLPLAIGAVLLVMKLRQTLLNANMEAEKEEEEETDTEGSRSQEANQSESISV